MAQYHNPRYQCEGKIPYRTKRLAKARARELENKIGARLRAYHCGWCDWYHLGNHPGRPGDIVRREERADA